MRRAVWIVGIALIAIATFIGLLLKSPSSVDETLVQPLRSLAGSGLRLHSILLTVSESAEPVRSASRRLLQPLGVVKLVQVHTAKNPKSPPN